MKFPAKYWIPGAVIAVLILSELALRLALGLGNPVLFQADADTGYRYRPNQTVFRFGNKIQFNQYSQRSEAVTTPKPPGMLRILMTGDSITNGGTLTDQTQTIAELFEARLATKKQPVEVLNASAGSWGIGNQLAYLRKFGTFDSDAAIAQIGTDDLTQPTSTSDRVGHDPSYPDQAPVLAIQELLTRYARPRLAKLLRLGSPSANTSPPSPIDLDRQFQENLQHLSATISVVRTQRIPIFVLFTPNLNNLVPTFNEPMYKPELLQFLNALRISIIDAHQAWSTLPKKTVETFYQPDGIHLTVAGNQAIADLLFESLCSAQQLPTCSS
jgi:lysophospholipase L1-like esterase